MDFQLTEEQKAIRETIADFLARECPRELVREVDEADRYPADLFRKLAGIEFCGLNVPEEYGGAGSDPLAAMIVSEELSTIYPVLAAAYGAATFCGGRNISELGTEPQQARYLPGLAKGSIQFSCGLYEGGSRLPGDELLHTTAERIGDRFVLNGAKTSVLLADQADFMLTLAGAGGCRGGNGSGFFFVDLHSPGVGIAKVDQLGYRGANLCTVQLNGVTVREEDVVGGMDFSNRGPAQVVAVLETESLELAACAVGIGQGAYQYAAHHAKDRVQFGRPIVEFGAVSSMLVDVAIDVHAARLMAYRSGWLADRRSPCLLDALMARTYATDVARKASLVCVQVLGGYGYTAEYDAQRYVRDSVVLTGRAGAREVLQSAIGDALGLRAQAIR